MLIKSYVCCLHVDLIIAQFCFRYDRIIFTFPRSSVNPNNDECNRQFLKSLCDSVKHCLNEPDGELHLLMHFNEKHLQSQYDHWKVDQMDGWTQIDQLSFNMDTIKTKIFPGYQPRTEKGKIWKPVLPVLCLMGPDFGVLREKEAETIEKQMISDFELALTLSFA